MDVIWADLQTTMFSAIVIERLLYPGRVQRRSGHTQEECQRIADWRAAELRNLLEIDDDQLPHGATLLNAAGVRNPLEHIDERFDGLVLDNIVAVSDFYVSHGQIFRSTDGAEYPAKNFRVFVAPHGLLLFDGVQLDLYAIDHNLLELLAEAIPAARRTLQERVPGRNLYSPPQLVAYPREVGHERIAMFPSTTNSSRLLGAGRAHG